MRDLAKNRWLELIGEITSIASLAKKSGQDLARLSSPMRFKVEQILQFNDMVWGHHLPDVERILKQNAHTFRELQLFVADRPELIKHIGSIFGGGAEEFVQIYSIIKRFSLNKGVCFTLREPLIERLLDTHVMASSISADLVRLPFSNVFLELGEPEFRESSAIKVVLNNEDAFVEGFYLSEIQGDVFRFSPAMRAHFGIAKERRDLGIPKPNRVRMMEVGVSYSLVGTHPSIEDGIKLASNPCTHFTLVFPDESMSMDQCIDLNIQWLKKCSPDYCIIDEVLPLIIKSLIYINMDSRIEERRVMPKELEDRINSSKKPSKRRKAAIEAMGLYTTTFIGSKVSYVQTSQLNKSLAERQGGGLTKRPHIRRGYLRAVLKTTEEGPRYVMQRVSSTIVNKRFLSKDELEMIEKNYIVFGYV